MSRIIHNLGETPRLQNACCIVTGCKGVPQWKPILLLKPMGWRFMGKKVAELPVPHDGFLCNQHRDLPMDKILNLEERNQIARHLFEQKVTVPDWTTARIGLAPVKKT